MDGESNNGELSESSLHLEELLDEDPNIKVGRIEKIRDDIFNIINGNHKKKKRGRYYQDTFNGKVLGNEKNTVLELGYEGLVGKELPIVKEVDFEEIMGKKKYEVLNKETGLKKIKRGRIIKIVSTKKINISRKEGYQFQDEKSCLYKNEYTFEYYTIKGEIIIFSLYSEEASKFIKKCLGSISKHMLTINL